MSVATKDRVPLAGTMSYEAAYRLAWRLLRQSYGTPANIARETHCRTAQFAALWLADVIYDEVNREVER